MLRTIPLILLLVLSAFFSAAETAFFNLTVHQRQQLAARRPRLGRFLLDLLKRPDQLLVTLLLANLAVNIGYFAIVSGLVIELSHTLSRTWVVVAGFVPVLVLIAFGEVLPKVISLTHAGRVAVYSAPIVWAMERAIRPVGAVLNAVFTRPAMRLLAPPRRHESDTVSHEELAGAMEASARDGLIDRQTGRLLAEVVELKSILVREVMVPRVDVKAHDLDEPRDRFMQMVRETGLKRLPVYRGDLDHIVGMVEARSVLLEPHRSIESMVRPVPFVPDVINVAHLLAEFRRKRQQYAAVVDEYGGTAGMVTLEDLVEEIVGDIYDPLDRPISPIDQIGPDEYRVAGDLSIREWSEFFGHIHLPHAVHTIAGLISALLGRVPRTGDVVRLANVTFTVEVVQRRRVRWAKIRREQPGAEDGGTGDTDGQARTEAGNA